MKRFAIVPLVLCWTAAVAVRAQSTERVSVDSSGAQSHWTAGDFGNPHVSGDGRFVAFTSNAADLVAGDTNFEMDAFVRDRATGQTTRVSVDSSGAQSNQFSRADAISADGRYVALSSAASNLVAGDTNGALDVFVHDRVSGQTTRVSVDSAGSQANNGAGGAVISADGRFVAFTSSSTNLVAGDLNGAYDAFVHDRVTGTTVRASISAGGFQADGPSWVTSISADGQLVVLSSDATNLVVGDTNGVFDVFVRDLAAGTTTRVSVTSAGGQVGVDLIDDVYESGTGRISADGRAVAFWSSTFNLVPNDTNQAGDMFVHDRVTHETTCVSVDSSGMLGNADSNFGLSISDDGRYVAFGSTASNLVPSDTNIAGDVFVHDRQTGRTTRASVNSAGAQSAGWSSDPSLSADARFVAFHSDASDLVAGDTNGVYDVFLRDRGVELIAPICPGDGSTVACPCGNNGAAHHGCATSIYARGGYLGGYGMPSVAADTFLLQAQEVSGLTTLFYQGDAQMVPTPLDDGLACASGSLIRLGTRSIVNATAMYPEPGDLSVSVRGMIPPLGGTRYYQCWYRNALPFCTPATTNRTNGLIVVWQP